MAQNSRRPSTAFKKDSLRPGSIRLPLAIRPVYALDCFVDVGSFGMRLFLLFACAMTLSIGWEVARAEEAAYTVTYIEALPSAKSDAAALIKEYADAGRKQDGIVRLEALRRLDRPNHFAIVAVWRDQKTAESHAAANATKQFRTKLQPLLSSPYDERPHTGLSVASADGAAKPAGAVYAVTHVDIIPPRKDDGMAA